jgi:hypothetical protein
MRPDELSLEEQLIASTAIAHHRKGQNPMDKISFQTNVPQTIALKYANGKRVESRYNEYEVYYTTTDGRALYATPALDARLTAFEPEANVPFSVCKVEMKEGNNKRIEWQVLPVKQQQPALQTPAAVAIASARAEAPLSQPQHTASAPAPAPPPARLTMTQMMGGALIASIDALTAAREYGATKGWELEFDAYDVRASAVAIFDRYFDQVKEHAARQNAAGAPAERVNGGTAWQQ